MSDPIALSQGILFTDFYELTMAQVYFRLGIHERPALFDHFFRAYPNYDGHQAGFCLTAGLQPLVEWMREARFGSEEIEVLQSQKGRTGQPLFAEDFLRWLHRASGAFEGITLDAIVEGRVIHPNVPMTVVEGPLAMAQLLETVLLNQLNYATLIATKAARIRHVAGSSLVLEMGVRRAHGWGANAGTRVALVGGATFTSNVGMAHLLGLPPKGTHADSMVQAVMAMGMGEEDAFRAFAETYPDDTILLLDTVDVLHSGLPNAIRVFEELQRKGHKPLGVRIDSGDLAHLSILVAKELNAAGFADVSIVLSNDLDELTIWQIVTQIREESPRYGLEPDPIIRRLVFGVGTKLITSWGEPALGGVYKLVALCHNSAWIPTIKLSETPQKMLNPGRKRVWRLYDTRGKATADVLGMDDEDIGVYDDIVLRHPLDATKVRTLRRQDVEIEPLHERIIEQGRQVVEFPPLAELQARGQRDIQRLDSGVLRLVNPHIYHVSLTQALWDTKQTTIEAVLQRR